MDPQKFTVLPSSEEPSWLKNCGALVKGVVKGVEQDAGAVWIDYCKRSAKEAGSEGHGTGTLPSMKSFGYNQAETGLVDGQLDNVRLVFSPWMTEMFYTDWTTLLSKILSFQPWTLVMACVPTYDPVHRMPEKTPELWVQVSGMQSRKRKRDSAFPELSKPHVTSADVHSIAALLHNEDVANATNITKLVRSMIYQENQPQLQVLCHDPRSQYYELRYTHWNEAFHFYHMEAIAEWSQANWEPVQLNKLRFKWSLAPEERALCVEVARASILRVLHQQTEPNGRTILVDPRPRGAAVVVHQEEVAYEASSAKRR